MSGGGSDFLKPVGVFPCKALCALCRSKVGGNHMYSCVRVLKVEGRVSCLRRGPEIWCVEVCVLAWEWKWVVVIRAETLC